MFVKITHTAIYSGINIVYKVNKHASTSVFASRESHSVINLTNNLSLGVHHLSFGVNEIDGETLMYQIDGGIPQNLIGVKWADVVAFELISPTGVERIMINGTWESKAFEAKHELDELPAGIAFMHLLEQI